MMESWEWKSRLTENRVGLGGDELTVFSLQLGADRDKAGDYGWTPLHVLLGKVIWRRQSCS